MEFVIAEQLRKRKVLTCRYFQRTSRADTSWAGSIGGEDVTRIQWHKTWGCSVSEHILQVSYVGLPQWRIKKNSSRWSDFSAASGSELAVSAFLSVGYFELLQITFSTMTLDVFKLLNDFQHPFFLYSSVQKKSAVFYLPTRTIEAYDMLHFCSCTSLAITKCLNTTSTFWKV